MNELSVFHACPRMQNWIVQPSCGSSGAALGFPASAACEDEGVGGGGGEGGVMAEQERGGKLLTEGIRNVQ